MGPRESKPTLKDLFFRMLWKLRIGYCPNCHTWFTFFNPKPFEILHHCRLNLSTMKFEKASL